MFFLRKNYLGFILFFIFLFVCSVMPIYAVSTGATGTMRVSPATSALPIGQQTALSIIADSKTKALSSFQFRVLIPVASTDIDVISIDGNATLVSQGWSFPVKTFTAVGNVIQVDFSGLNTSISGAVLPANTTVATINVISRKVFTGKVISFDTTLSKLIEKSTVGDTLGVVTSGTYATSGSVVVVTNTPTQTPTQTLTPTTQGTSPFSSCDGSCEYDSQCLSGLRCFTISTGIKRCRNEQCATVSNCQCSVVISTPTITPYSKPSYARSTIVVTPTITIPTIDVAHMPTIEPTISITPTELPLTIDSSYQNSLDKATTVQLEFSGKTEPNARVSIEISPDEITGTAFADGTGGFAYSAPLLTPGDKTIIFTATDVSGRSNSTQQSFVVNATSTVSVWMYVVGGVFVLFLIGIIIGFILRRRKKMKPPESPPIQTISNAPDYSQVNTPVVLPQVSVPLEHADATTIIQS